jgi:ribosomal protein S18 acetylase RimI-like enzyme
VCHVVRRLPVGAFAETAALGKAGYRLVDVSVLFEREGAEEPVAPDPSIRLVREGDADQLAARFAEAFSLTRFAVDPFFSKAAATELHRRWIVNSCAGRADAVLVADIGGVLRGFVTCRVDQSSKTGNIELIAVDGTQRGAGIGRKLVNAALHWFSGRTDRVQVRTQLNNVVATRLYQSSGFRLKLGELTYTWVLVEEKVAR